jgi:phenylpyruvate tautomerase PptA (4-oxalocrotonate tautomerase family)
MPFIHVKSLPFQPPLKIAAVVEGLTKDFSKGAGIGLQHVTATWEFLSPGHYAVAGKTAARQPQRSHPVLVDLLTPDFNTPAQIEKMLLVIVSSISRRAKIPKRNIFVNHRQAHSGRVFDDGEVVRW